MHMNEDRKQVLSAFIRGWKIDRKFDENVNEQPLQLYEKFMRT